MSKTITLMKRELSGYFATPVAYVFMVIFLLLSGILTFYVGNFYENSQSDLQAMFTFHPWLYLFLVPAISMRLWAEERKSGTIELLMTLPVSLGQVVLAKFLAAWIFAGLTLALTFPLWITVGFLGDPDNGVILASYLGSFMMAGGFLAIGACVSASTKNQVIAFVIAVAISFIFVLAGYPAVLNFFKPWAGQSVVDGISSLSFLTHFYAITTGIIDLRDLVFFASLIGCFLFANATLVELKKAD